MSKVVGDIAVTAGADVTNLLNGMRRAGASVSGFDKKAKKLALTMRNVGVAVGTAAVAITAGTARFARSAAATAKEIDNLARISGTSAERFQRFAVSAREVGIEQEKLADIFKDTNDKFGDFMATGAGPLADFFENIAPRIGVTADQFARLSGPEALQLYVSSLEKAGVSQQQMTFYMEALASDATALYPLLKNNGEAVKVLGDEAERTGRILSNEAIAKGAEMDRQFRDLSDTINRTLKQAILDNGDQLIILGEVFAQEVIPKIIEAAKMFGWLAGKIAGATGALGDLLSAANDFASDGLNNAARSVNDMLPGFLRTEQNPAQVPVDIWGNAPQEPIPGGNPNGPPTLDLGIIPANTNDPFSSQRSGGGSDPRNAFEILRERYRTQREIVQEERDKDLAALEEFHQKGVTKEQEYLDTKERITREHSERMKKLDEAERQARVAIVSGLLGELAGLMSSENEKLFRIGQAAAIAGAVVNTYEGITQALAKYPPPISYAYAAATAARGFAAVASIKAQSPRGGAASANPAAVGGTGAIAAGSVAADQSANTGRPTVSLTLIGEQGFTRAQIVQIAEALNDSGDEGQLLDIRGQR